MVLMCILNCLEFLSNLSLSLNANSSKIQQSSAEGCISDNRNKFIPRVLEISSFLMRAKFIISLMRSSGSFLSVPLSTISVRNCWKNRVVYV